MSASGAPTSPGRPGPKRPSPGTPGRECAAELALLAVVHAVGGHRGPAVAAVRDRLSPSDWDLVREVMREVAGSQAAP